MGCQAIGRVERIRFKSYRPLRIPLHRASRLSVMRLRTMTMDANQLVRTPYDSWIGGVCGGIARWLGWDSNLVRLLYVLLSIGSAAFPGILVYIVLWIAMPEER